MADNDLSLFHGSIYDTLQSAQEMDVVSTFTGLLYFPTFKETHDINGVDMTCILYVENRTESLLRAIDATSGLQKLAHMSLHQVLSVVL